MVASVWAVTSRPTGPAAADASPPQGEFARQHPFHPVFSHYQQDKIRFRSANLQAESAAFNS